LSLDSAAYHPSHPKLRKKGKNKKLSKRKNRNIIFFLAHIKIT